MRILFALCCILGAHFANAQHKTERIQMRGGVRVNTGPVADGALNETYTSEFISDRGFTPTKITFKKDLEGKWTFTYQTNSPSGELTSKMEGKLELKDGKFVVTEYKVVEYQKGITIREANAKLNSSGKFEVKDNTRGETREYNLSDEEIGQLNSMLTPPMQNIEPEKKLSQIPKDNTLDFAFGNSNDNCGEKFILSLGPSYLNRDYGNDKKAGFGLLLAGNINFNSNIAGGVSFSTHSTKIGTDFLVTSYYLANGQYTFGQGEEKCDPPISIFSRIALGMMRERLGRNSGSGPAFGAGAGATYQISDPFKIGISGDYIIGKINDRSIKGIRVTMFLAYGFKNL
jgi:hypothetical protein